MKTDTKEMKNLKRPPISVIEKHDEIDKVEFRGLIVIPFGQDKCRDQELKRIWSAPSKSHKCKK